MKIPSRFTPPQDIVCLSTRAPRLNGSRLVSRLRITAPLKKRPGSAKRSKSTSRVIWRTSVPSQVWRSSLRAKSMVIFSSPSVDAWGNSALKSTIQ